MKPKTEICIVKKKAASPPPPPPQLCTQISLNPEGNFMVVTVSLPSELRRKLSSLSSIKTLVERISTFESQTKKKNNKNLPRFHKLNQMP